jgi:threonine/homoserine/homoserine lactone efflux protein
MWAFVGYATVLGLSAGIGPGPLLAVVISQTVKHNAREGIKVAIAPILTDAPIIGLGLLLFSAAPDPELVLGIVSFVGAAFVFALGVNSMRQRSVELQLTDEEPRSYLKGALVNALNPHPYLFWISVGVPTMIKAHHQSPVFSVAFVATFFFFIVGSKMAVALIVGRYRDFLAGRAYRWTMRFLGVCLIFYAILLLKDGLSLIGAL